MKWRQKYIIDIDKLYHENRNGASLVDLSNKYNIPRTTLNRYFSKHGLDVMCNRKNSGQYRINQKLKMEKYTCSYAWKKGLVLKYGYKCMACGYDKIVEAHYIVPSVDGGEMTICNGSLFCPNCHAEAHAGILEFDIALLKRDELLENPEKDNQQPSHKDNCQETAKVVEGSTTSSRAEAVMEPRASRSNRKIKCGYLSNSLIFKDMI